MHDEKQNTRSSNLTQFLKIHEKNETSENPTILRNLKGFNTEKQNQESK